MAFQPEFNYIEELKWRGLLHDMMPGTEELLQSQMVTGYAGFDPTADSLHIGNMVPIMLLLHLQRAGHRPIALVGGATGMVGDPSGKSDERKFLDLDILNHNLECQKQQLMRFLNFESGENKAIMVNNYDWFSKFGFLEFIRDVGKHITVSYMMSKDSVKNRLESGGLSFTEFTYQLVQGYDFLHLFENFGCKVQVGGSDQWGNITTGTELIRRKVGGEAFAITAPLITKSDGTKFGKSEGGNIWLDGNKTNPYKFYQFWLNINDADIVKFIKIFSLKNREELDTLIAQHTGNEHMRLLQKSLAEEFTTRLHGENALQQAIKATNVFFGNGNSDDLKSLQGSTLMDAMEGMDKFEMDSNKLNEGISLLDLLAGETSVFSSKGEARKMIQANGFSLNKQKINDPATVINPDYLLQEKYLIAQKGKTNFMVIEIV
ncbi:MAG: tyrosine--tRNA ligase [Bacteroidetes bacterium]|nr:tyrosine--tRNA ligase [Bacteroidota bacterium]